MREVPAASRCFNFYRRCLLVFFLLIYLTNICTIFNFYNMYKQIFISNLNALGSSMGDSSCSYSSMVELKQRLQEASMLVPDGFSLLPWTDKKHAPATAIYEHLLVYPGNEQKSTVIVSANTKTSSSVELTIDLPLKDFPSSCKYLLCLDRNGYDYNGQYCMYGVPELFEVDSVIVGEDDEHIVVHGINGAKVSSEDELPFIYLQKDNRLLMLTEKPFLLDKSNVAFVVSDDSSSLKNVKKGDVFCCAESLPSDSENNQNYRMVKCFSLDEKINAVLSYPGKKLPAIDDQSVMCDVLVVSGYSDDLKLYADQYDHLFLLLLEDTTVKIPVPYSESSTSDTKEVVLPAGSFVYRSEIIPEEGEIYIRTKWNFRQIEFDYFFR